MVRGTSGRRVDGEADNELVRGGGGGFFLSGADLASLGVGGAGGRRVDGEEDDELV